MADAEIQTSLLAVFWDIENCCVPRGKSAMAVVHCIRDKFLCPNHKEAEFLCVCDVSKEPAHLITELNDAQVTVVHISNEHKNAADEKLRQCMRKFCDSHKAPVTLVLISGDVDFATDLSHMRHSHKYKIILVHNKSNKSNVKQALAITAHEVYTFDDIIANAPEKEQDPSVNGNSEIVEEVHWVHLTDLPTHVDLSKIKSRLYSMASKTKGMVLQITKKLAIIQYTRPELAERATKRMNGQDVFGTKISSSHVTNAPTTSASFLNSAQSLSGYNNVPSRGRTGSFSQQTNACQYRFTDKGAKDSYGGFSGYPTPPDNGSARVAGSSVMPSNEPQSPLPSSDYNTQSSAFSRTPGSKKTKGDSSSAGNMITSTPQSSAASGSREMCPAPQKHYPRAAPGYQPWDDFNRVWTASSTPQQRSLNNPFGTPIPNTQQMVNAMGASIPCAFRPIQQGRQLYNSSYGQVPATPYNTPTTPRTLPQHGRTLSPMNSSPFSAGLVPPVSRPITAQTRSPLANEMREGSPFLDHGNDGIALAVTNLDYNISGREWKKILHQTFQQYIQVLNVTVQTQSDGSSMALVYVPNQEDARFGISQCHRKKIGYKRIQVSMYSPESPNNAQRVRSEVASILGEVSGNTLPLFKFIEIYEKRFYRTISVSELYHMKDTVEIKEQSGKGRMVCLQTTLAMPGHLYSSSNQNKVNPELVIPETPYCRLHCKEADFTLLEETGMLPYVKISLEKFSQHVFNLIQLHDGDLPLMSFTYCYSAAYTELKPAVEGGVPLEHLISCVSGVHIKMDELGVKRIIWQECRPSSPTGSSFSETSSTDSFSGRTSQTLSQQLSQFSREVVDLLKRMPGCQMSFSKFIPSYHHHFGRQCRVADFGFTKLLELFEAIPHVLQILGTGNQRILYLTHRIHLRRFTADLLRVLKSQAEKHCTIADYPELYSEVIGTDLNMPSFGVCYIKDMLIEVSDSQVIVSGSGDHAVMSIPRKDQTPEEIERTKQFSYEVIDLLKNCPQCTMVFNKFIPSYHHHFGRQCRVADYGFSKLLELFEAIPDIVNINESGEERYICLTKTELYKVLSEQLLALLSNCANNCIEIKELGPAYQKAYGHNIYIEEFGVTSLEELVAKIPHIAHVENKDGIDMIVMKSRVELECLARRSLELLITRSNGEMRLSKFMERFNTHFDDHANLVEVKHSLYPAIIITQDTKCGTISLHPLLSVARRIMLLLSNNQGKLTLLTFEMAYRQSFGISLNSQQCGFPGVAVMLQMMDFMVSIRGRGARQTILLRQDYLARLAHQLAYKVGIFTELVKYKDLRKKTDSKPSASSDSGILEDTSVGRNESIHAGSPDIFVTGLNSSDMVSMDLPSHMSMSQNRMGLSSNIFSNTSAESSAELNNACRMLGSLSMEDSQSLSTRKPPYGNQAQMGVAPTNPPPGIKLLRNTSQQAKSGNTPSPKHRRLAASFDNVS